MFGAGGLGGFLPMLGVLGGGFSGGGLFSLGFTLLSGVLQNIGSPKNPGFENFALHPGFGTFSSHPGFGTVSGGPNVQTVGAANGYFGAAYSSDYSVLPHTPSGQYYANAGYSFGSHALSYAPAPHGSHGQGGYRQNFGHLNFGGNLGAYHQNCGHMLSRYPSYPPAYHHGQSFGSYGSAPAPYSQNHRPVLSHYGFGSPRQYNPASVLFGHQSGAVRLSYGRPQHHTTYGGPQGDKKVVHHHHHHHLHVHLHKEPCDTPKPVTCELPVEPKPYKPVVEPKPEPKPIAQPKVDRPARIVTPTVPKPPQQTEWARVPHINSDADWPRAAKIVGERITGGDAERYTLNGQNPLNVKDGMQAERFAAWHVFQQNDSLRLDLKSGYFYETSPSGKTTNKFHLSSLAAIERQYGNNPRLAYEMVGEFLSQRSLLADGLATNKLFNTSPAPPGKPPVTLNDVTNFGRSPKFG